MTNATLENTVKSRINEERFFKTMGHLFASSYSFLGELMQNARRAGASGIDFTYDDDKKTLMVVDDGKGVEDFAVLIQFCESKWGEDVVHNDKPFGMGLYSLFFACDTVRVRSRGLFIEITLNDVIEGRSLAVKHDDHPVRTGTIIEMVGLKDDLHRGRLWEECMNRAKGFAIPVLFNGKQCPRPHAQEFLQGETIDIGFISLAGVHVAGKELCHQSAHLYLQGLPIDGSIASYGSNIIHLDSQSFSAVMPDRSSLYDKRDQSARIRQAMRQVIRSFLERKHAEMPGDEFVVRYWHNCLEVGVDHLLNSTPYIPGDKLLTVVDQSMTGDDNFGRWRSGDKVVSRDDVLSGKVKIWRNAPHSTCDRLEAAALLRVMESMDIHSVDIHGGHWLADITPDCQDLYIDRVTPSAETNRMYVDDMCEAVLVDAVEIEIKSRADRAFSLTYVEDTAWIVVPAEFDEDNLSREPGDTETLCYFVPSCTSQPSAVFSSFTDASDSYVESWHEHAQRHWLEAMRSLKGQSLGQIAGSAIENLGCNLSPAQAGHVALLRTVFHWSDYAKQFNGPRLRVTDLMEEAFWVEMADVLSKNGNAVAPEAIRQAFMTVARAGEKVVPSPSISLCGALGVSTTKGDEGFKVQFVCNGELCTDIASSLDGSRELAYTMVKEQIQQARPLEFANWETLDFEQKLALGRTVFGLD